MQDKIEYLLNNGEANFVVSKDFLTRIYWKHFSMKFASFSEFLNSYSPSKDGMLIFKEAQKTGNLVEEKR